MICIDLQDGTAMSKREQMQEYCEATVRKLYRDRDALLVVAKRIYAELDNIYDVDEVIGDGDTHTKEYPFSGAGELMTSLRIVIERAEKP